VDQVEAEGIRRARSTARTADIVVLVVDASLEHDPDVERSLEVGLPQRLVVALNKSDLLPGDEQRGKIRKRFVAPSLFTSALSGEGIHELREALYLAALSGHIETDGSLTITNERHYRSFVKAREAVHRAREAEEKGISNEFIAFDVREGAAALSEITGEITSDDILNSIFGRFCIGK